MNVEYVPMSRYSDDLGRRIVVLKCGWAVVGKVRRHGPRIRVTECSVVRRWGTPKGLWELAVSGPIAGKTVLDACPPVECLESEVVLSMEAAGDGWK